MTIIASSRLMRLDRFLTLYFFGPLLVLSKRSCDLKIPILMYHSIARDVDNNVHPYYRTVTTPETFEKHMRFLRELNYEVVTLSEAVPLLQRMSDQSLSQPVLATESGKSHMSPDSVRRPLVVTFDDGFRDFYNKAFPILEQLGFRATVFLTSGYIDKSFLTGRECLRTREVKELAEKGIEFGSHTVTHPQLKGLSRDQIAHELVSSKKMIENIIGSKVSLFSYPYRFPEEDTDFTKKLGALLIEQGYSAGVTTAIGLSGSDNDPLFLKRLPVNDCDDSQFLKKKLEGAYDWLHKGQLTYKKSRVVLRYLRAS